MAKEKGYAKVYVGDNGVSGFTYLGMIQMWSDSGGDPLAIRFQDGICFGEYDSDTDEFIPETNPYVIPRGSVQTIGTEEGDYDKNGNLIVQGGIIDHGLDIARKKVYQGGFNYDTPNVSTSLDSRRTQVVKPVFFGNTSSNQGTPSQESKESKKPVVKEQAKTKPSLIVDWESLL